jgi:hypothetical protein
MAKVLRLLSAAVKCCRLLLLKLQLLISLAPLSLQKGLLQTQSLR